MSHSTKKKRPAPAKPQAMINWLWIAGGALAVAGIAALAWLKWAPPGKEGAHPASAPVVLKAGETTFNRDIAPIVFENCARCHRPGQSGPFNLLTYADVKKHAKDIVEATQRRYMPPWLPEAGHEPFVDEQRLTDLQIARFARWLEDGTPEGRESDLPPSPQWVEGWQLGQPDLVVTMPEPYTLPPDGKDVYRNFVIQVPTTRSRFVRAFEFRPGSKAVHHAFIRIDSSHQARQLDARDPGPGFGGMNVPPSVESPSGYFLSWQPGRRPGVSPDGMAWVLPAGADVVLLAHLQPRGRPEPLQASIGFYFTDLPPTNAPVKIGLRSYAIDIPAGATNYTVEESVKLPVDASLIALVPHAHYLGKRLEGFAVQADGTRQSLLVIPDWDFNWQREYRLAKPVALPRGTLLQMKFSYDNSTNNTRNPHSPPERVGFGMTTADEMGEMWFQLIAQTGPDSDRLRDTAQARILKDIFELSRWQLSKDPNDAEAMAELGKIFLAQGETKHAEELFRRAIAQQPSLADGHYHLGLVLLSRGELPAAEIELLEAVRLNPDSYQARNNLGLCYLRERRLDEAALHFREVLRLHPDDEIARQNLQLAEQAKLGKQPAPQ